jgi:hypothetical protein
VPYISITDGRTARYDSDSVMYEGINGLYTDHFSSCNIFILYKQEEGRVKISMTHADFSIKRSDIEEEIKWMGENFNYSIVRRKDNEFSKKRRDSVLEDQEKSDGLDADLDVGIEEIDFSEDQLGVSIGTDGSISFYGLANLPDIITHHEDDVVH